MLSLGGSSSAESARWRANESAPVVRGVVGGVVGGDVGVVVSSGVIVATLLLTIQVYVRLTWHVLHGAVPGHLVRVRGVVRHAVYASPACAWSSTQPPGWR